VIKYKFIISRLELNYLRPEGDQVKKTGKILYIFIAGYILNWYYNVLYKNVVET